MHAIDALRARRVLLRPFVLFFFVLLSWFVTPHAQAVECPGRYAASGAYPADPMCPLKAAAADFGGMGGYVCGDPSVIASYCSGPSATDTTEPVSPEGSMPDDPDNCAADATAGCGSSTSGGEPVNLYTGQFYFFRHDLALADTLPLDLARTYRSGAYDSSGRPLVGAFGVGGGLNFDTILAMSTDRQRLELRQATGIRVPFTPRAGSSGKGWDDLTSPGEYYRARIDAAGTTGLTLTLRDGRIQRFTSIGGVYRLSRLEDRNGNAVVIARDSSTGAITSVSGPNGRTLTFTSIVGARGTPLISRVTDPLGRQVSYTYDSADRLVQVTDAAGGIWKYGWDGNSRLAVITDPEGNLQVASTYDGNDRVIAQKLADGSTFAFAYTLGGGKATQTDVTDRRGSIRRVEFDANGRVVRNTYPLGDATQQVQTFTYDATGRVTNLTAGDRQYTYGYDTNGNRISEADQYGTLHTRTHDSYSQVLTDAEAGDPQRGVATVYTYDAKGNLLTVTDRLGNRTTFTVDAQGRVLTVTDALKGVTRYTYTGGDLTAVTDPLNRTTQYTTDAAGRVTAVQDPLGNRTKRTLDALDRTTDITDALNGVTRFTWDRNGHLLSQSDPKGVTTRYTYNAIGRPVSKTDPLGRSETYTWTSAGQLASVTDRKGQLSRYTYDAAGRLARRALTPPAGDRPMRTQSYGWDTVTGKFQITSQSAWKDPYFTDNAAVLMVKRDPVSGKVASVQEFPNLPGHQTQQFGYAPDSRDLTRVVLNDATVEYMRDAEHRITQAQYTLNDEAPKTFTFAYDALGRRSKATLGNGIAIGYTWDAASQLTGITYGRSDGTTIGTLTYTYDAAGRRTGMGGSLAKTALPQPVADAQYNGANQLTRWAGKTFTYDANGSLTSDGVNRYGWGVTGEFSQIDSADGSSIQYQYDVLGRRKRTIANGSRTTDYLNVGDDLAIANTDDDWSHRLQQFPLFIEGAPDELLMRRNGDDPATDRYVLRDANNNVIALTDAGQNIVTQYRYEPYGQTTLTGAADANPQQYTGRENDGTGLYYYRNRYYHPATGRFISEDPIGYASGQTNAYAYVGGNPVQFTDPRGLQIAFPIPVGPMAGGGFGPRPPGSGSQGLDDWLSNPSGGTFADSNADDPVVYPDNPKGSPEKFGNITGSRGKQCLDGSVWEKDTSSHGGDQWKRWPNRKSWEKKQTPQSVWPDGRIRK